MKEKLINYINFVESNFDLFIFVESYKDPKNKYFRVLKILKNRYGYNHKTTLRQRQTSYRY